MNVKWERTSQGGVTWTHPNIGLMVRVGGDHHGAFKVCLTEKVNATPRKHFIPVYEDERWGYATEKEARTAGKVLVRALMAVFVPPKEKK